MTKRRKLAIATVALLTLAIAMTPAGQREVARASFMFAHATEKVTEMRVFSLDRLDPTCPQCI